MKQTPLNALHRDLGARLVAFSGWEMPVQYSSIIEEHKAVRTSAGWFDVSHMGEISVAGPGARAWLNTMLTNDLERIYDGKAIYSLMCHPDGGVIDDVIVHQRAEDDLLICVNASNKDKDYQWLHDAPKPSAIEVRDVSNNWAQIAVQGPRAWDCIRALDPAFTPDAIPKRFHFVERALAGAQVLLARTGYTGEDGCEIYLQPADAVDFSSRLLRAGAPIGLIPAGLGARDSLRLEAGYPLYGHEISASIDPLTAGLGWAVKLGKPNGFTGSAALTAINDSPLRQCVKFFKLNDRRIARTDAPLFDKNDKPCGRVLSGTLSPILQLPIGSALLDSAALQSAQPISVDIRNSRLPIEFVQPPLHR